MTSIPYAYAIPGDVKSTVEIDSSTPNGPSSTYRNYFGSSVSNIGDLDCDGIADIAVGAFADEEIYILFLDNDGTPKNIVVIDSSTPHGPVLTAGDWFGWSIVNMGDLDGDGVTDIAVGARIDDDGGKWKGVVHIIFLNSDGTPKNTVEINSSTINGPTINDSDYFGASVSNIGDLDGDGVTDIAVGAMNDSEGGSGRGTLHIIFLNSDGTPKNTVEINSSTINGPVLANYDYFGTSVSNIGDLDGDGVIDIAVGAHRGGNIGVDRGTLHIIFLNSDGTPKSTVEINSSTINGPTINDDNLFGSSVANIGDLDGDGIADIAVGEYTYESTLHILFLKGIPTVSPTPTVPVITTLFGIVGESPITIDGTGDAGSTVNLFKDCTYYNTTLVDGVGDWQFTGIVLDEGETSFTATATDGINTSVSSISIIITLDTIPPIITLTGDNPQTIELGAGYTELGATTDDGSEVTIDATAFVDIVGSYSVLYDSVDAAGNDATQVTRTVNVVEDIYPIIILTGDNPQLINQGDTYVELGATCSDNTNEDISDSIVTDASSVDTISLGIYSVTYDCQDAAGNDATQVTRTVNVVDGTTPVITLTGDNPQTIELGAGYTELGATTDDGSEVTIDATAFVDIVGSYSVLYDATDGTNSAIQVIRTVNVVDTIHNNDGCKGDCEPPTLGINSRYIRMVENGFVYNGNATNVEQYYTPYPLITVNVGEPNKAEFKIYDNYGIDAIRHFSLAFGMAQGEIISQSKATIDLDMDNEGNETVTVTDPENTLGGVVVSTKQVFCDSDMNLECLGITIYHTFREPLDFDMVGTNVWDAKRNGWQNYYNDGIRIVGESINPPKHFEGIYRGHIITITETGKNIAIDKDGDTWTFEKIWKRDHTSPIKRDDPPISNEQKINAIRIVDPHVFNLTDKQISEFFSHDRNHDKFTSYNQIQLDIAYSVLSEICPKCQDKHFSEINDIVLSEIPNIHENKSSDLKY